ncbi:cytochrome P450 [Saccharomonospora marina XMU15]|uniref:Cytochrome P450 n=1 Tax=Saccharomonospora marina XMU15 TaxID=882083 RepID=H5X7S6_9PSEU|nr:4-nitrotryptophan synthase [Saccharomonospora marina]EHR51368.1 cytochrome P450 [Saccharomonospora marina XMU15]
MVNPSPLSMPAIVSNPYPVYADLAEREPVHWCESLGSWAILKYDDCVAALKDPRFKAERMEEILSGKFSGRKLPAESIYHRFTKNVMMYTDEPRHTVLRKSTQAGFTNEAHAFYSQAIERVAHDLVASVPDNVKEIDAVPGLAEKLPVNAAVHAFGVPEEDLDVVIPRVVNVMTYWSGPQEQPLELEQLLEDLADLHTYASELVAGKRGRVLPDTVIARLAADLADQTEVTPEQTVHQLVLLLVALFAPTTPGSVGSGMLAFATNPDQIARFLADSACVENTPNEVVRYNASNQFTWRVATTDVEMGGVRIKEGQRVALFLGAANRDPAVFEQPNKFDLDRSNSGKNLSFGFGPHACLGRQIASLEIKWFFVALFARFPTIRLAGEPEWNTNLEFRSLRSLPLSLG